MSGNRDFPAWLALAFAVGFAGGAWLARATVRPAYADTPEGTTPTLAPVPVWADSLRSDLAALRLAIEAGELSTVLSAGKIARAAEDIAESVWVIEHSCTEVGR